MPGIAPQRSTTSRYSPPVSPIVIGSCSASGTASGPRFTIVARVTAPRAMLRVITRSFEDFLAVQEDAMPPIATSAATAAASDRVASGSFTRFGGIIASTTNTAPTYT